VDLGGVDVKVDGVEGDGSRILDDIEAVVMLVGEAIDGVKLSMVGSYYWWD